MLLDGRGPVTANEQRRVCLASLWGMVNLLILAAPLVASAGCVGPGREELRRQVLGGLGQFKMGQEGLSTKWGHNAIGSMVRRQPATDPQSADASRDRPIHVPAFAPECEFERCCVEKRPSP